MITLRKHSSWLVGGAVRYRWLGVCSHAGQRGAGGSGQHAAPPPNC
jgi:hypothetical protein